MSCDVPTPLGSDVDTGMLGGNALVFEQALWFEANRTIEFCPKTRASPQMCLHVTYACGGGVGAENSPPHTGFKEFGTRGRDPNQGIPYLELGMVTLRGRQINLPGEGVVQFWCLFL